MGWLCTQGAGICEHEQCKPQEIRKAEDRHALAVEAREIRLIATRLERFAKSGVNLSQDAKLPLALIHVRRDLASVRKLSQGLIDRFGKADR